MKLRTKTTPPEMVQWTTIPSPAGKLAIGMTKAGEICRISFVRKQNTAKIVAEWRSEWPKTEFVESSSAKKYSGKPILLIGTPFQQSVWRAMLKVPAGKVTSYGKIARQIGKPKAARAVGTACGANPVPYLVPCHRVVGVTGLGGFSGGLDIKKTLLKSEGYL